MAQDPDSPRARFGFRFVVLARQWRRLIDARLAEVGLTDATWAPLVHLSALGGGVSQTELAGRIGLDASSLVRLLDILCERGLIERRVSAEDRRAKLVSLTPEGRTEVARIRRLLNAAEAEMLVDLEDSEIEAVLGVFDKIAARAEILQAEPLK